MSMMRLYATLSMTMLLVVGSAAAQDTEAITAEGVFEQANNPLAKMTAFNIHNYHYSDLYGTGANANTAWLRFVKPFGRLLLRASLPLRTGPTWAWWGGYASESGLGDANAFLAYLLSDPTAKSQYGVGPLVAAPTATDPAFGVDAWQLGAAAVYFNASSPQVQWGGLLTWQTAVSGEDDANVSVLQPFLILQLGKGTYLRSTPLWVFDIERETYNMPIGFGIGKVVKVKRTVFNMFIEPQWTILHDGYGQTGFAVFAGLNLQFLPK